MSNGPELNNDHEPAASPTREPIVTGHRSSIQSVKISPNGGLLATASDDTTIRIWNAASGSMIMDLQGHTDWVLCLSFSPDSRTLASGSRDKHVRLWDLSTGANLVQPLEQSGAVGDIVFSPDGKTFLCACGTPNIGLWDAYSYRLTASITWNDREGTNDAEFNAVDFAPDGSMFASGSSKGSVLVWRTHDHHVLMQLAGRHEGGVSVVRFSPNGTRVASAGQDRTVHIWDCLSGDPIAVFEGHKSMIISLAFLLKGSVLVSAAHDETLRIWNVDQKTSFGTTVADARFWTWSGGLGVSPDGRWFVAGSSALIAFFRMRIDLIALDTLSPAVDFFAPSKSRRTLAERAESAIRFGDMDSPVKFLQGHSEQVTSSVFLQASLPHRSWLSAVRYSPDGTLLATATLDHEVYIWDMSDAPSAANEPKFITVNGHKKAVKCLAFSPDGKVLASGSTVIILSDPATGKAIGSPLWGHERTVRALAFSRNGTLLGSASEDETVRIWDVKTGEEVGEPFKQHHNPVNALDISPDGLAASGSSNPVVLIWDIESRVVSRSLRGHTEEVRAVKFSPGGVILATAAEDYTIRLWDYKAGTAIVVLSGHTSTIPSLSFAPSGGLLVSCSIDETLRFWDTKRGVLVGTPVPYEGVSPQSLRSLTCVDWCPDGETVACGTNAQTMTIWNVKGLTSPSSDDHSAAAIEEIPEEGISRPDEEPAGEDSAETPDDTHGSEAESTVPSLPSSPHPFPTPPPQPFEPNTFVYTKPSMDGAFRPASPPQPPAQSIPIPLPQVSLSVANPPISFSAFDPYPEPERSRTPSPVRSPHPQSAAAKVDVGEVPRFATPPPVVADIREFSPPALEMDTVLSYLDTVRSEFADQRYVYEAFLHSVKNYKPRRIADVTNFMATASSLFVGHTDIILGLNALLPDGFRVNVDPSSCEVSMTTPQAGALARSGHPFEAEASSSPMPTPTIVHAMPQPVIPPLPADSSPSSLIESTVSPALNRSPIPEQHQVSFLGLPGNEESSGRISQPSSARVSPGTRGSFFTRELTASGSGGEDRMSVVTWWSTFNVRRHESRSGASRSERGLSEEQVARITDARKRVTRAAASVLGTAVEITHEALTVGVDLLDFAPIPGLAPAGHILLEIWSAFEKVQSNRSSCLRLTERCASILTSVREEAVSAGSAMNEELKAPIDKLHESFTDVLNLLRKQMDMPFLKRFLGRDKVLGDITQCDKSLSEALGMFGLSIQIRTLKLIQHNSSAFLSLRRHSLTSKHKIQENLEEIRMEQNKKDRNQDLAELRQLLRAAVQANDDVAMVEILQVGRDEMPEAMQALERTLNDYVVEHDQSGGRESRNTRKRTSLLGRIGIARPRHQEVDLDRRFMENGIESLRRLTLQQGNQPNLPNWTITRYEIDVDQRIGVGFFSNVYKGTWRNRTVAIKMLADTTPQELFVHEADLWKRLSHPNILQLLGASSTSSDPPWFFVSPYYKNGNLVKYLKGLPALKDVVALQMIHEIASGMTYLHEREILHGDLKAVNVLVDDTFRCVITDFGQSELKSEVYRLSRMPVSRGTLRWQAPELLNGADAMTQQIDVYAFAISCAEVLTKGSLPWPLLDDAGVRHKVLVEHGRPPLSSSSLATETRLRSILDACWNHDASYRPSFSQISTDIGNLLLQSGYSV